MPAPKLAEEPQRAHRIACCHCGMRFDALSLRGAYLERSCPACGALLSSDDYDKHAREEAGKLAAAETAIAELQPRADELSRRLESCRHWWQRPLKWWLGRKLDPLAKSLEEAKKEQTRSTAELKALAFGRYYVSEWFQLTHIPTKREVVLPHLLVPSYDGSGAFRLSARDKQAAGIRAEWAVFEHLLGACRDEASPLFGARPLPNLYLPHERRGKTFWSQTDLVLLSTYGAFVIEVKSRRCDVAAFSPFEEIVGPGGKEWLTTEALTSALAQNSRHAADFMDACGLYSYERVFEQTVFFSPTSFRTDCRRFVGNVNVSALGEGLDADFVGPIASAMRTLDEVATPAQVGRTAGYLLGKYGDLNQKRYLVHARSFG